MTTITPTRDNLDPYFTVTWAAFVGGDTCTAFDALNAELVSFCCLTTGANLMASLETTFTPVNTSPNIGSAGTNQIVSGAGLPKARWYAPYNGPGIMTASTMILLFKNGG